MNGSDLSVVDFVVIKLKLFLASFLLKKEYASLVHVAKENSDSLINKDRHCVVAAEIFAALLTKTASQTDANIKFMAQKANQYAIVLLEEVNRDA